MTTRGQLLATLFTLFALFVGTGFVVVQQIRAGRATANVPVLTASASHELGCSRWRGHYRLDVRIPKGIARPDLVRAAFVRHLQRRFGNVQVCTVLDTAREPRLGTIVVQVDDYTERTFKSDCVGGVDVLDYLAVDLRLAGTPRPTRWDGEYLLNSDVMVLGKRQPHSSDEAYAMQIDALVADLLTGMIAQH